MLVFPENLSLDLRVHELCGRQGTISLVAPSAVVVGSTVRRTEATVPPTTVLVSNLPYSINNGRRRWRWQQVGDGANLRRQGRRKGMKEDIGRKF